jgi:hypothetical protein
MIQIKISGCIDFSDQALYALGTMIDVLGIARTTDSAPQDVPVFKILYAPLKSEACDIFIKASAQALDYFRKKEPYNASNLHYDQVSTQQMPVLFAEN